LWIVTKQGIHGLRAAFFKKRTTEGRVDRERSDGTWVDSLYVHLRTVLLIPMLVALFCFAGLVTTGDIGLTPLDDGSVQLLRTQQRSRDLAEAGSWIYRAALSALGVTSLVFLFPRNLFKSARKVEDRDSGKHEPNAPWPRGRGWEPIFRVVVFLCSYG